MGSASSIINKQFPQFTSSNQLTIDDVNNCDRTWILILSDQTLSPDYSSSSSNSNSNSSPDSSYNSELSPIQSQEISSNLNNLKSTSISLTISKINNNNNNKKQFYRLWFYKLCYQSLKSKFEEDKKINGVVMTSHNDPNALHTIVIFMLKLVSIYITSLKAKKAFEKYAKSLSLSSAHLGIRVKDYHLFQNAFLETIQTCFQSEPHVILSWKKLFSTILRIVLPECVHQESTTSIKRQLRLSGNSNLRDSPENDVITYYAEYAFKLISTMSNDENDLNSVNSRLSTSLHNSIENEYDNSDLNRIEIHNKITMVT